MDFEVSEDQESLREISRSMLAAHCPPALVRALGHAEQDVDDKLWRLGADLGWLGLVVEERLDGAGQGIVELCLVAEELGRAAAPGPFAESALAARAISGAPAAPAGVLDDLMAGAVRATWVDGSELSAEPTADGLVLTGTAAAVHAAGSADWLLVCAGPVGSPCLALVPRTAVASTRRTTLDETRRWHRVDFEDVTVAAEHLLPYATEEARQLSDAATLVMAADSLGVGERLLEMTRDYVVVREQFDRPLGSFQSVKHKLADMLATLKGARAAVYYAAMALDAGTSDASRAVSVAKAFTSEGVSALASEALQTHGGIGFTWEHDLHLFLRRAKVDELLFGAPAEHHERVLALTE
ncbi:MAG: acyl-CoA dehydrogenase family protein [Nocardioides sp.]|uniref:acyl-CoA dehydrogenase family protein n=1 Tax=Nocardioides sp. TaxID=35761 RepID=UPI0039E27772